MDRPAAGQQYAATFMHSMPPATNALPMPRYGAYQQQIPHSFYLPPGYAWFPSMADGPVYGTRHPSSGCFSTRRQGTERPSATPSHSPYGSPIMQHGETMGVSAAKPGRQDLASICTSPLPSGARGPPCKPRQSGWAVWVGNLPQYTTVIHLKDHFSIGARNDIESAFLMAKTNCAFVNYRTEQACLEAIQRFDNHFFRGHRLVCRMRRGSLSSGRSDTSSLAPSSGAPSLSDRSSSSPILRTPSEIDVETPLIVRGDGEPADGISFKADLTESTMEFSAGLDKLIIGPQVKNKMFILKSLTLQDLLVSTRDGSWTAQPHNEEKLNEAFHSAENVYLIFSVNKSGEYFGYARMESPIVHITSPTSSPKSSCPTLQQKDLNGQSHESPRTIPTPATSTAPEGRITDDSARGTIFWEAERPGGQIPNASSQQTSDSAEAKQFKIRWISTAKVPFRTTRGLRNPLNSNREVKIARDGTEVHLPLHRKSQVLPSD